MHTHADTLRLIFWELTSRCNLHCKHCRADATDDASIGELTTREITDIATDIRTRFDPILVLTGGEPLIRSDFFDIVDHCCRTFTRVAVASNGTLIDDAIAPRMKSLGVQRVSLSIDGSTAHTHDRFRGQAGSFAAAWRGFDALRRADLSAQINTTVTRANRHELADLLTMAIARGADALHVFMLVPVGCGATLDDTVRLTPNETEEALRWLAEQSHAHADRIHIKATCAPQYFRILRQSQPPHTQTPTQHTTHPHSPHSLHAMTRGCLAGTGVCFISRTGNVQPCGYLPISAGNVRTQSLSELWQSSDVLAQLRDPNKLTGQCGECEFRMLCSGCRARAYAHSGNVLAADPDCAYRRSST
jgi:radical SAM protein with 4Fe4S-binding SPASM domain